MADMFLAYAPSKFRPSFQAIESPLAEHDGIGVPSRLLPGLERSPRKNWVEIVGGLPIYIERIAKQLHYIKKMTISRAIATSINTVKKWCATGDVTQWKGIQIINQMSHAQACLAAAQWEAMKGAARAVLSTAVEGLEEIISDSEFFKMVGLVWPEDIKEFWDDDEDDFDMDENVETVLGLS